MLRRHFLKGSAAAAALVAAGPGLIGTARAETFINVLTGGTSGVYYPLGVAMANLFNQQIEGVNAQAQSTKASVENLNLLQQGKGELALTLGDAASLAWQGNEEAGYPAKLDKLRHVAGAYSNFVQIVASADSGITSLADLKGKRVSVGAPKSGTELNARAVMAAAGLSYDDFEKTEYLPFGESVDLMKNRQLDATLQSAGLGVGSIKDLATSIPITIVPIPAAVVAAIGDPAYQPNVIPAGTYEGQTADVETASIRNLLLTHADVPETLVYQMITVIFENLDTLVATHKAAAGIVLDASAAQSPIPLHPGAEQFYKEQGLL